MGKFHYNSIGMSLRLDESGGQNLAYNELQGGMTGEEMRFRRNRLQMPQRHRRDQSGQGIIRLEATKGVVQGCSQVVKIKNIF